MKDTTKPPPVADTPLPKKEMFVTACVYLSESFANSMLFPFVAFMIWDFGVADSPTQVGFYAGLLASSFSFAQFISSFWWGVWSDRVGRKRALMAGMAGSLVAVLLFGLSVNFVWALVTRTLHGLLNGNLAVARSYVGDVTDDTNQARAMSITSLIYGLGVILGPTVGGFLSQPADKYGSLFPPNTVHGDFLAQFPYFLPCLVSICISATGMVGGYLFLDDKRKPGQPKVVEVDESEADPESVRRTLDVELAATQEQGEEDDAKPKKKGNWQELRLIMREADVVVCAMLYGILTFSVLVFVETFALWSITAPESGGLAFSSTDVGAALAVVGLTIVVFQIFIYSKLERRFGSLLLFRLGLLLLVPIFVAFPVLNLVLPFGTVSLWLLVIVLSVCRALGATMCYTSVFVLINNAADPETRGAANGFSEAVASIAKTIGPVAGGAIFAWSLTNGLGFPFNHYFMFIILAVASALGAFLSLRLDPARVNGARRSADEARGLLDDWREKQKQKQQQQEQEQEQHEGVQDQLVRRYGDVRTPPEAEAVDHR